MCEQRINKEELEYTIKETPLGKSPGADRICNKFLQNIGTKSTNNLLNIFNMSWVKGYLHQDWKSAIIIPIPKEGKPPMKSLHIDL